jgi:nucleosome assembly protein 1-like 1
MKHLIKVSYEKEGPNRTYYFQFSPNDYFKNDILKKQIFMESDEVPSYSVGTEIEWCDGKDLTKKMTKKK